jgi:haloalkane dehalogenase
MAGPVEGLAYREAGPEDGPVALLLHGYPESSYMWRHLMPALARQGRRAIAPDLLGFGDSESHPPHTWERHVEAIERFHSTLGLERVALIVHDWGGLIGLRWACDQPAAVNALVISATGFFPDGRWHGVAQAARTPGTGEEMVEGMTREGLAAILRENGSGFDDAAIGEYWKCFGDEARRRGQLEFWRSADFEKLEPYDGRLADLGVPTLILWGETDPFAFVPSAHRFHKEIPGSRLVMVEGAGHFVFEDAPERTTEEVAGFLGPP